MQSKSVVYAWIGARDVDSNNWLKYMQSKADVHLSMWAATQPNHGDGDCVWFNGGSGKLFLENCGNSNSQRFVCEAFLNP